MNGGETRTTSDADQSQRGWSPKLRILVVCSAFTIPLDQITKAWIVNRIPQGESISLIEDLLYVSHVRNTGGAFGLLRDLPEEWRVWVFGVAGLLALAAIVSFFRELAPGDRMSALALSLILGGAAGNLTDRATRGEVVDFIHVRLLGGYAWPDFNFADVFIVSGVVALAVELLAAEGKSRARVSESGES